MTLEEKAEEYIARQCYTPENLPCSEHRQIFDAYIAGAKENGVIIHDLKADPTDYPKEKKLYIVSIQDNGSAIAYFNGSHWETKYNMGDFGHLVETITAWCEIPI